MLKDLTKGLEFELLNGSLQVNIEDICYNSKEIKNGCLFVCLKGFVFNGHDYIDEAIDKGAVAVVVSDDVELREGITYLKVENTRHALAILSSAFFGNPSRDLTVIGITGTKGKTTISYMLSTCLQKAQKKVGVIGTIGCMIDNKIEATNNTTPESYELQRLMRKMVDAGCEYCIMEVSSQGLMIHRVDGIDFDYGIFTNLSPDHIGKNEHHSFEHYMECKKKLFQMCKVGIFNRDEQYYEQMVEGARCCVLTYSIQNDSHLQASQISLYRETNELGTYFDVKGMTEGSYQVNVPGRFSVYNALAVIMTCSCLHLDMDCVHEALRNIHVKGRDEIVPNDQHFLVMIDYAHNAISYQSLLETISHYHPNHIICVYGAGGQRDVRRRFESGEIIAKMGAYSIVTADNPRNDSVSEICADIVKGIKEYDGEYVVIEDRKEAIRHALSIAQDDDIVLCLGKGHEDYQIIGNERIPFSERKIIEEYFK